MEGQEVPSEEIIFMKGGKQVPIMVPISSERAVVIPSNEKGTGFLRNMYPPSRRLLGGLISSEEFRNVVDTSCKLTAKVYSHNRKKDVEGIPTTLTLVLTLASILVFAYFACIYVGITNPDYEYL